MVRRTRRAFVVTLGAALAGGAAAPAFASTAGSFGTTSVSKDGSKDLSKGKRPLARAHAHNDYEHPRPLLDALSHGFGSVEADIWLVEGELLVAHDATDLDPTRTLESLYLDPLARRVKANGGRVYRGHDLSLQLLIDLKTAGEATYLELAKRLRHYGPLFSAAYGGVDGRVRRGAVTAVISGDRGARAPMEAEKVRHAFYDGRLEDLGSGVPASFIPLISADWTKTFTWTGTGPMPRAERETLHRLVASAHTARQTVRFWATPDVAGPERDALWRELLAADVDYLNTDDLAGLEAFLRAAR
ncbi:phosphatidylinositol-specific phospholipase C/glycerophosphodiester phosphodiesterase family protein [Streptomyces sp. PSAA01]|uniref:phosphatidylinositol-specific phospholipase C/glycerophosphodiester phosphodiesterase family protein n=1 Tax=Streptomyces sp. PSAA01 TaxID=2912762 RepID=UPI001F3B002F|nr:phosphatidylinositol-specific phospholipase C/glycerophosphodiester phosphodiesterase family protein [Streptomyces sp. PSAA01]MCG0287855.1 phosphatidylinositol-specific phospholipase C/glycerophosphodiester phosphodiesterase family protein [Streptomyces sp. PSAA01]